MLVWKPWAGPSPQSSRYWYMEGRNCEVPIPELVGLIPWTASGVKDGDMTLGATGDMTRDVPPGLLISGLMG